jgi:hypothetical protein
MGMNSKARNGPPAYFYKYRSLSGEDRERTLLSIVHGFIWFSSPTNFKDENDCRIPVSYEATPEEFRVFAERALSAVMSHLTREERTEAFVRPLNHYTNTAVERLGDFGRRVKLTSGQLDQLDEEITSDLEILRRYVSPIHKLWIILSSRSGDS